MVQDAELAPLDAYATSLHARTHHVVAKRVFDALVAGAALVMCSPILIVAAIAVRLSSPGPVCSVRSGGAGTAAGS